MNPEVLTSATMVKARTRPTARVSVQRTTQVDRETIAAYGALITALLNNAVDNSDYIFMPLAPKLAVLLGLGTSYQTIDDGRVDELNGFQAQAAQHEILFRPGAGFDAVIPGWR